MIDPQLDSLRLPSEFIHQSATASVYHVSRDSLYARPSSRKSVPRLSVQLSSPFTSKVCTTSLGRVCTLALHQKRLYHVSRDSYPLSGQLPSLGTVTLSRDSYPLSGQLPSLGTVTLALHLESVYHVSRDSYPRPALTL